MSNPDAIVARKHQLDRVQSVGMWLPEAPCFLSFECNTGVAGPVNMEALRKAHEEWGGGDADARVVEGVSNSGIISRIASICEGVTRFTDIVTVSEKLSEHSCFFLRVSFLCGVH